MNPSHPPEWLVANSFSTVDDAVIVLDAGGLVVSLNPEAEAISGVSDEEARGIPFETVFLLRDEFSGKRPDSRTQYVVVPSSRGELLPFELVVVPHPNDPNGPEERATGWTVVLRPAVSSGDIEFEGWSALARHSKEGTGIADARLGTLGIVSEPFAAMHGYIPDEMLGMPFDRLYPPDLLERFRAEGCAIPEADLPEIGVRVVETEHIRKDGERFPVLVSGQIIRDPIGTPRFRALRVEDVTELKAAERREEAERRLKEHVLEVIPSVVYLAGPGTARPEALLSRTESGNPFSVESLHPEDRPRLEEHMRRLAGLADGEIATFEYRLADGAGAWRSYLSRDVVFERDAEGRVVRVLGAATDVTHLKDVERSLRESEALRDVAASAARTAAWIWDFATGTARL